MWRLPDGRTIRKPTSFTVNGVLHLPDVFAKWTKEELAAVGVRPVRNIPFDRRYYQAASWTEELVNGEIIRTPALEAREVKETMFPSPEKKVFELPTSNLEIIDAGQDAGTEEVWVKIRVGGTVAYLRGYLTK